MLSHLKGILPAVVTPLDAGECFAGRQFELLLERLYAAGVHGVYVCGGTGEGLLQSVNQRKLVAETAIRCSPSGKQVIVHVGSHRTADAIELARHASKLGAAAVSALPPIGAYTFPEVRAYYAAIAAVSEVPLLVYYFPEFYPGISTADQILELCDIDNVAGLKFTDFDLFTMRRILQTGAVLFNGRDEILAAGLMMGACGGIGTFYNLAPVWFVDVYEHGLRGDWSAARDVQDRINALIAITLRYPLFPAVKQILRWQGIDCGECIRPRAPLTAEQVAGLRVQIQNLGLLPPA